MNFESVAKTIGGAVSRALHLTIDTTNRISIEVRNFEDAIEAAADGFEKKYIDLYEMARKFKYTVDILQRNNYPIVVEKLKEAIQWLEEHSEDVVDKKFYGAYMYAWSCDIYKNKIKNARNEAGLTQKEFSEMFEIPLDTVKHWDSGRRNPPEWAEKLIIEKLGTLKKTTSQ